MNYTSSDLKDQAKAMLKGNYPVAILVFLIYTLISSVTVNVDVLDGAALNIFGYLYSPSILVFCIVSVLIVLVIRPLMYGAANYFLNLKKNNAKLSDILKPFKVRYGRNVIAVCLEYAVVYMTMVITAMMCIILTPLAPLLMILAASFLLVFSYMIRQVPYILMEDEDISAIDALAKSVEMMKGEKWNLFVLELSFIGWFLLSCVTLGISEIYSGPYRHATYASFYKDISRKII
ncbi:MAG: DUF975 family protein [Clostridia bacterium]